MFVLCEIGKKEHLNATSKPGQSYLVYPQASMLYAVLGLVIFPKYISIHYYTKLTALIVFAFNNRSSVSRLTSP